MCTVAEYRLDIISEIWVPKSVGDKKSIVCRPHEKRFGNRHKNIVRIVPTLFVYYDNTKHDCSMQVNHFAKYPGQYATKNTIHYFAVQ